MLGFLIGFATCYFAAGAMAATVYDKKILIEGGIPIDMRIFNAVLMTLLWPVTLCYLIHRDG